MIDQRLMIIDYRLTIISDYWRLLTIMNDYLRLLTIINIINDCRLMMEKQVW